MLAGFGLERGRKRSPGSDATGTLVKLCVAHRPTLGSQWLHRVRLCSPSALTFQLLSKHDKNLNFTFSFSALHLEFSTFCTTSPWRKRFSSAIFLLSVNREASSCWEQIKRISLKWHFLSENLWKSILFCECVCVPVMSPSINSGFFWPIYCRFCSFYESDSWVILLKSLKIAFKAQCGSFKKSYRHGTISIYRLYLCFQLEKFPENKELLLFIH